jgi:hypothetical protein
VRAEEALAAGLADAVRRGYPETTPGAWLAWLKGVDGARLAGLLLVVLWMLPVAAGGRTHAQRRLVAAWLASCGALGMAVSLSVMYRLQMRFGMLYLLGGVGSCLYLAGLFCGNRVGQGLLNRASRIMGEGPYGHTANEVSQASCVRAVRRFPVLLRTADPRLVRCALLVFTLAEAGVACGVLAVAERAANATCVVLLCFVAGCAAGLAVPAALAACEECRAESAAVFVLADAWGAAAAGLFFVALVPLADLRETVVCFAALACGLALCAAAGGRHARLTAGLALAATLALLGGRLRDAWPEGGAVLRNEETEDAPEMQGVTNQTGRAEEIKATQLRGIPRKVDVDRIRGQMGEGQLSTHAAAFWEGL